MNQSAHKLLHTVARLYNVKSTYWDMFGRFVEPPPEALLAVLQLLGAPVERMEDLGDALRQRRQFLWQRGIDPVNIAWDGKPVALKVRLPIRYETDIFDYQIRLENGDVLQGICRVQGKRLAETIEGTRYVNLRLLIPETLPLGYHELEFKMSDLILNSHLFAAPTEAFTPKKFPRWGLFCPLYALASKSGWGAGDFSQLEGLIDSTVQMGGNFAGTLPLLPAFLNELYQPSPYAPVSRLFWNELFLDVTKIPELQRCAAARAIVNSPEFQVQAKRLQAEPLVDYRGVMALKRRVLQELARSVGTDSSRRSESFRRYRETYPAVDDYAAFRARVEREGTSWSHWPAAQRDGTLSAGDYDEGIKHYHLYVQWQANEQVKRVNKKAQASGAALYLDFPLGVNRDGYDVWRERQAFAVAATGGAPPDLFFTKGQNWGFPPLHPESIEEDGYGYYIRCLRHHLQSAGMLRIDHVMGLHRLFWIPEGFGATEGVYVGYPAEKFYAILSLESHRNQAEIVGENLGTVPPHVNATLVRHKIGGMYVGQFSISPESSAGLDNIPEPSVASLNTHDTPTFAGFWKGADICDSAELGLLSESQAVEQQQHRALQRKSLISFLQSHGWLNDSNPDPGRVLKAWLCHIGASNVERLLVNLEDLWLEPWPQNVPGTWEERPNWRRKAYFSLTEIRKRSDVTKTLKSIDRIRKGRAG